MLRRKHGRTATAQLSPHDHQALSPWVRKRHTAGNHS
jgi:hypothetical protein